LARPALAAPAPGAAAAPWTPGALFRAYRGRILFTYALINGENVTRLAQPYLLGLAIDDLLKSSWRGLGFFTLQQAIYTAAGVARRMYDARGFTGIYAEVAGRLVRQQRGRGVPVSSVAARSALSRQLVDFFERDLPIALQGLYSVGGALIMLALSEAALVPFCLVLLLPTSLLSYTYGRKTLTLNARLHDELEREVGVIDRNRVREVRGHYRRVARWEIRLADCESLNFGLMQICVLGLMVAALVRSCLPGADAGHIAAVFGYLTMFVLGLINVPLLVEQFNRLRDIGRRVRSRPSDDPTAESSMSSADLHRASPRKKGL
jgi:hypothetical protein